MPPKVKQTTIDSLHRHTVVSRQEGRRCWVAAWARLQNLKSMHAQRGASKSCELRVSELRQGVIDQRGQDGARQVRCGALWTGMCLQGGGRAESHHSRFLTLVSMFVCALGCALVVCGCTACCTLHCRDEKDVPYRVIRSRKQLAGHDDTPHTNYTSMQDIPSTEMEGEEAQAPLPPLPLLQRQAAQFQQTAIQDLRCGQSLYASRQAEITKKSGGVGWLG